MDEIGADPDPAQRPIRVPLAHEDDAFGGHGTSVLLWLVLVGIVGGTIVLYTTVVPERWPYSALVLVLLVAATVGGLRHLRSNVVRGVTLEPDGVLLESYAGTRFVPWRDIVLIRHVPAGRYHRYARIVLHTGHSRHRFTVMARQGGKYHELLLRRARGAFGHDQRRNRIVPPRDPAAVGDAAPAAKRLVVGSVRRGDRRALLVGGTAVSVPVVVAVLQAALGLAGDFDVVLYITAAVLGLPGLLLVGSSHRRKSRSIQRIRDRFSELTARP